MANGFTDSSTVIARPTCGNHYRQRGDISNLTQREKEVAALVSKGFSNPEMALQLGISEQTVKNHMAAIFLKWRVHSRLEVALRVLQLSQS